MLTHPQMLTKRLWKTDIREMKGKPKFTRRQGDAVYPQQLMPPHRVGKGGLYWDGGPVNAGHRQEKQNQEPLNHIITRC